MPVIRQVSPEARLHRLLKWSRAAEDASRGVLSGGYSPPVRPHRAATSQLGAAEAHCPHRVVHLLRPDRAADHRQTARAAHSGAPDRAGDRIAAQQAGLGEAAAFGIAYRFRRPQDRRPRGGTEDGSDQRPDPAGLRGVQPRRSAQLSRSERHRQPAARIRSLVSERAWTWKRPARPSRRRCRPTKRCWSSTPRRPARW